jgi:hypothetical protein
MPAHGGAQIRDIDDGGESRDESDIVVTFLVRDAHGPQHAELLRLAGRLAAVRDVTRLPSPCPRHAGAAKVDQK